MLDVVDSSLWSDLSGDAQEFEAESWSLVVDPSFCSRQEKDVVQRQDVIFGKHYNHGLWVAAVWCRGKTMDSSWSSNSGSTISWSLSLRYNNNSPETQFFLL